MSDEGHQSAGRAAGERQAPEHDVLEHQRHVTQHHVHLDALGLPVELRRDLDLGERPAISTSAACFGKTVVDSEIGGHTG